MIVRSPAVAGRFYPQDPRIVRRDVESYLLSVKERTRAIGCMVPHAGYMYSGQVAGSVYATFEIPQRCIVLCPNHTGLGKPLAIMSDGEWMTPLGDVPIDAEMAGELMRQFPLLEEDAEAHRNEHAIEVQLPFLQIMHPDFTFVPIALGTGRFEVLEALGHAIGSVVTLSEYPVLLIASSDMNHYESDSVTRVKDRLAIDQILALDPAGLFEVVMREHISMCGFAAAIVMLAAAKSLGATSAELVSYATSGDVSGERDMVVGYEGMVVR
ncbi:MAG: AmmeMemoRadiSam system protein B [Acidobacteriales bacterium]|nr:AmmeMemoRadiSam system protein B [Terriglobales bacterium]